MPFDWESALYGALVTASISAAGFVAKRLWPSERRKTRAEEFSSHLNIAAMMKDKNLTPSDVEAVAAVLRGERRREEVVNLAGTVSSSAELTAV